MSQCKCQKCKHDRLITGGVVIIVALSAAVAFIICSCKSLEDDVHGQDIIEWFEKYEKRQDDTKIG